MLFSCVERLCGKLAETEMNKCDCDLLGEYISSELQLSAISCKTPKCYLQWTKADAFFAKRFEFWNYSVNNPADIYLLKVRRRFGVFIVNFGHISHLCSRVSIVNFEHVIAGWQWIAFPEPELPKLLILISVLKISKVSTLSFSLVVFPFQTIKPS